MTTKCVEEKVQEAYTNWSQTACGFTDVKYSDTLMCDIKQALGSIHEEVIKRFYGCGMVVPEKLEGMHVLDVGCGAGRDTFIVSKLVGQQGHVVGVDMTKELIDVANKYINYHMEKFSIKEPNVEFKVGFIEKLDEIGIKDNTFDILISNGVINLTSDKTKVLKEAFRVLKEGGELYFSDVYCNKELPEDIRKNDFLWGFCIAGALYWKTLHEIASEVGFCAPRLVEILTVPINNPKYKELLGDAQFVSTTYRMFKLPSTSSTSEDVQSVIYKGDIKGYENELLFDVNNTFKTGEPRTVDPNLATFLRMSRFKDSFRFLDPLVVSPFDYLKQLEDRGQTVRVSYSVD
ncbi:arsenite methyltransferase-like [Gigantopelta aegis]|uniref:arsenite methyltransferase-like n=1 Tax=Gigantopelta aegis TaxID=1735272 RepID=UPI001B88D79A|nr:arsenite methyltransferase-like [Gigantopelta aegis]